MDPHDHDRVGYRDDFDGLGTERSWFASSKVLSRWVFSGIRDGLFLIEPRRRAEPFQDFQADK